MTVVDASVIGEILLPDEGQNAEPLVADVLTNSPNTAPALLQIEVVSLLLRAARRKRILVAEAQKSTEFFINLPIQFQPPLSGLQLIAVLKIAEKHQLSAYDSTYLELALRLKGELATRDEQLARACRSEGVRLIHF